jgi:hypothetical protein
MPGPDLIRTLNEWTPEQLAPYAGKFVAWSEDGKHVLAAAASWEELFAEVNRRGLTGYVPDYVPTPEEVLGGFR